MLGDSLLKHLPEESDPVHDLLQLNRREISQQTSHTGPRGVTGLLQMLSAGRSKREGKAPALLGIGSAIDQASPH